MTEPSFTVPLSALVTFELLSEELFGWECRESFCGMGGYPTESAARAAAVEHLESVHGIRAAGEEVDHLRAENKSLSGRLRTLAQLVGGSELLGITHLPVEEVRKITGQYSDWEQIDDE